MKVSSNFTNGYVAALLTLYGIKLILAVCVYLEML